MQEESFKRTEISELGEFKLIKLLTSEFAKLQNSTIKGIGDDAAVIDAANACTLISTDLLIEGIHFDLTYTPLKHLGYKSIIVNLSDIYAMNAIPTQVTVSIAVSNRFSVEAIEEIYEGIRTACDFYKVDLVGGDTTSSPKGLVISVTAIGRQIKEKIVYRSGANSGDQIFVTGEIGAAYLGLQLLEREKLIFLENPKIPIDLEDQKFCVGKFLKPEAARTAIFQFAQSDTESQLLAIKFNLDPITAALNGGEDYELLFTANDTDSEKLRFLPGFYHIGEIVDPNLGVKLRSNSGKFHPITAQGWNHF